MEMQHLHIDTALQGGKYKILSVLGQGGFGITYLAENTMLDGKVAIKEFFFKEYCDRDETTSHVTIGTRGNREMVERFKQKFIKEARTIFKLNHPNIIRILDIFEENGTAYYVMEYIEGESLGDIVKSRGAIPEVEAIGYIKEVGKALEYIHERNMNHLDIKPNNIMKRRDDGQILLIDFGVAKQYDVTTSEATTTTPVGISHGYSPMEQYVSGGVNTFSPSSDVYSLAATLYKLLTGKTPAEAVIINDEGIPTIELVKRNVSSSVISTIEAAMKTRKTRIQTVNEFLSYLTKVPTKSLQDEETMYLESDALNDNHNTSISNEMSQTFIIGKERQSSIDQYKCRTEVLQRINQYLRKLSLYMLIVSGLISFILYIWQQRTLSMITMQPFMIGLMLLVLSLNSRWINVKLWLAKTDKSVSQSGALILIILTILLLNPLLMENIMDRVYTDVNVRIVTLPFLNIISLYGLYIKNKKKTGYILTFLGLPFGTMYTLVHVLRPKRIPNSTFDTILYKIQYFEKILISVIISFLLLYFIIKGFISF